jgi:hypothetical protein
MMKNLMIASLLLISTTVLAQEKISGTITLNKKLESKIVQGGALFVFAKKANNQMPVAVLKIATPKFPQNFELTSANVMIAGTKFEGPVKVTARYSPNGDVMPSKDSLDATTAKEVNLGASGIKLDLAAKK